MKHFGRGMWRRVGDFERIYTPQITKQQQHQEYISLLEKNQKTQLQNDYIAYYQATNKQNTKFSKN